MADRFDSFTPGLSSPLIGGLGQITPNDGADLVQVTREIYVTTAGIAGDTLWAEVDANNGVGSTVTARSQTVYTAA